MIRLSIALALVSCLAHAQPKPAYPALPDTAVYKSHSGCAPLDLSHWHHPTREVLQESKVALRALDLCDDGRYPIFHVNIDNNPLRVVDPFYATLYAKMWIADGKNPLAIDIENWRDVVDLEHGAEGVSETDEIYRP